VNTESLRASDNKNRFFFGVHGVKAVKDFRRIKKELDTNDNRES
jgi:hypothetical protein